MSWLMFLSLTPLDKGESVGAYVARAVDVIDRSGLDYRLTAVGTVLEADSWEELARVVQACLEDLQRDCRRISVLIKVDYREGPKGRLRRAVESVAQRLGRPVPGVT
ncbi:MAG: MTH1187 family thiamine-binding protein [Acidobacteria bacterium]|nr:MTH1187 family thiamine-binding protein [Acidobacteriota bacterium]MDW7984253.1 MTH1187 family thiamine-binding protein [Acidobacteriota bacterium]